MESIAKDIIQYIISKYGEVDPEEQAVYCYGMECILNTGITIFILLVFGIITDTVSAVIVWLITFDVYRNCVGGIHADTSEKCIITSSILGVINVVIVRYPYFFKYYNANAIFIVMAIIALCCAPVKNDKVHLSREQKYIKKTMILILILVTFIARDYIGLKYMISIINALLEGTVLAIMSVFQNQLKGLISGAKLHKL